MYQQTTIVGYLGKDPEMKFTPAGHAVTSFSVATSYGYTNASGQKVEETTWWRVSVFGGQADACKQYLAKGRPVLVVGRIRPDPQTGGPRIYTKQDGTPGASFEIMASNVRFLPSGSNGKDEHAPDDFDDVPEAQGAVSDNREVPF